MQIKRICGENISNIREEPHSLQMFADFKGTYVPMGTSLFFLQSWWCYWLLIWSAFEDNQETQLVPAAVQNPHSCAANEEMKGFSGHDGSNVSK